VSGGGERNINAIGGIQTTSDDVGAAELKAGDRKEAEEQLLFKDMQVEVAGRILRQIAVARRNEM